MGSRQLVFEDRPDEAVVEEPGRAIDDMEWLGIRIIDSDAAIGAV
jgi:hypothetical protein